MGLSVSWALMCGLWDEKWTDWNEFLLCDFCLNGRGHG